MTKLFASGVLVALFAGGALAQQAPEYIPASAEADPLSGEVHDGLAMVIREAALGPDPVWADDSLEAQGDGQAEILEESDVETEVEVTWFSESEVEETWLETAE